MIIFDIPRHRLHTQRLLDLKFPNAADGVAYFGAVQAQDLLPALWGLGLRTEDAAEASIEQATFDRAIIRTWALRSTIHFVTAADARWILKLSEPRTVAAAAGRYRAFELDDAVFTQSRKAISHALAGNQRLTRREVFAALEQAGVSTAGQRGYNILMRHSLEGLIGLGPRLGKQQSVVLLDEWLPPGREMARDDALAELAMRYFTSHGPATVKDFIWWSGLAAAEVRAGLEMVKPRLSQETIDNETFWFAQPAPVEEVPSPVVHLLPYIDEYLVAYKDRRAVQPLEYNALVDSGNVIFHQPILSDGRVAGIWTRKLKKDSVVITPTLFRPLTEPEKESLLVAAKRYGEFLGLAAVDVEMS